MSEMRYAGPSVCRIFRMSASWSVRNTVCRLVEMSEIRDNGRSLCRIYTGRSVSYIRYVGRRVCRKSDRSEIRSGSSSETVVVKKNLVSRKIVRSRPWSGTDKRRKLCNGHSQRVRVLVSERSRRRGDGGTGVDAGADGYQPPGDTVL